MALMTLSGEKKLRDELAYLKNVRIPKVAATLADARESAESDADAEVQAALADERACKARIAALESTLAAAEVVDITTMPETGRVMFGATVTIAVTSTGQAQTFRIVGVDEADPRNSLVSVDSPTARALLGKFVAEVAQIPTSAGIVEHEITLVRHL